ncbi:MAG TPA: hypothetical protein VNT33_12560, partial [Telluria sp.]|nr:hypothetical protein [Telluria sp.]
MSRRLAVVISSLVLAHAAAGARAAELGEAKVASHIGQQLVADIELVAIDEPSMPVGVRLASPDVYRGASLDMPAVLASLNMSVMRRDGRQYLHITSLKPVDTELLHLFLEVTDGSRRVVRQATLWFTPDPAPPAAVVAAEPAPLDRWPAVAAPSLKRAVAAAPAACPRPSSSPAAACAVLDVKNAMLRDEVGRLEDKVKLLQTAMGVTPAAAPAPASAPQAPAADKPASAPPAAAKPAAAQAAAPAKHDAVKREETHAGLPWAWIGGLG